MENGLDSAYTWVSGRKSEGWVPILHPKRRRYWRPNRVSMAKASARTIRLPGRPMAWTVFHARSIGTNRGETKNRTAFTVVHAIQSRWSDH